MAGYSGTPLPNKLGIKPGHRVACLDAPTTFLPSLGELPPDVVLENDVARAGPRDVIVYFVRSQADLRSRFVAIARRLATDGGFWVAWPKRTSGVATDLTEDVIRAIGLDAGLVDNKVCAIDETWSGLRFVVRLRDRPKK